MTLGFIKGLLNARLLYGEEFLNREVYTACGSDMMYLLMLMINPY